MASLALLRSALACLSAVMDMSTPMTTLSLAPRSFSRIILVTPPVPHARSTTFWPGPTCDRSTRSWFIF